MMVSLHFQALVEVCGPHLVEVCGPHVVEVCGPHLDNAVVLASRFGIKAGNSS